MSIIELCGGLGNQLFQYAFGKTIESYGTEVYYNASWYNRIYDPPRLYLLNKFKVDAKLAPPLKLRMIVESKFPAPEKMDGCDFRGYWQHVQYYEKVIPILKNEFCLKEEVYTEEFLKLRESITNCNSLSVHIRRSDYITQNACFALPFDYYMKALKEFKKGDLFIFSDDIPWCKEHFIKEYFSRKIVFVDLEDFLCFELMKLCKNSIIANSTFSIMSALVSDESKKVICPSYTQVSNKHKPLDLPFPENWIKLC